MLSKTVILATLLLIAASAPATAQVTGTVRDEGGGVIPGADVSVTTAQGTVIAAGQSNAQGQFRVPNVPAGQYVLVVRARAFREHRQSIEVKDAGVVADVTLEVGAIREDVTVTATPGSPEDLLRTEKAVNIIDREDVLLRSTTVVAEVVTEETGIHLQRTSPTVAGVFVRGLTGNKVNVFVDGVRFSTGAARGGINTFLDLIEPTALQGVEVLRGPSSTEYGSDALGGSAQFRVEAPELAVAGAPRFGGQFSASAGSAHEQAGGNLSLSYRGENLSLFGNVAGRHAGSIRPGEGVDSHAAVTRFLGLESTVLMDTRLPDTGFDQYGGLLKMNWAVGPATHVVASYMYGMQNNGKRYDQLLGGDGNLIADLNGVSLNLFYVRLERLALGWFDYGSLTYSLNSQREERVNQGGNGNPRATISHEPERTTVNGVQGTLMRALSARQTLSIGGDVYLETLTSVATNVNPVTGQVTARRPRVPDGAIYRHGGAFAEIAFEAVPNRVKLVGAVRAGGAHYEAHASDSPLVNGQPLWPDDSLTTASVTFRGGAVLSPSSEWTFTADVARGFRAPHMTDLGTLGLTGSGFEVAAPDVAGLNAMVGNGAGATAVSSGKPVEQVGPETSLSFDAGVRYRHRGVRADLTFFVNHVYDNIQKQALILPQGAVGTLIGGQPITAQGPTGVVYVSVATNPVLVRANYDNARIWGIEHSGEFTLGRDLALQTIFTYIRTKDTATGLPPNIEGGTPAPDGYLMLRYQSRSGRWWVQPYLHAAADQTHLSSLDLEDRRTGALRSRSSIRSFFLNGATARGWVGPGADGVAGTADDILLATGETLAKVQDRVLGVGVTSAPLFTSVPGYVTFGVRGGVRAGAHEVTVDVENVGDRNYRGISWGVDAPGVGVAVRYLLRF